MFTVLLQATIGLALVLILRRPMRRLFGASPAFTLWLLPPMLALLPCLPAAPSRWLSLPEMAVLPATRALVAQITPAASPGHWVFLIWAIGGALCLLRLARHYQQLLRQSRPAPDAMVHVLQADFPGLDPRRLRLHPAGPALLWGPCSMLLLPADFLERFDPRQRHLVLQHEHAHLHRGDALWSLLGELMLALLWFHPLAWLALPRLRLDQELACDERVLRQLPQDEAGYAHTLLHSTGVDVAPMFIPWLTQPQLKERLTMIQRPRPGTLRRHIGFIVVAMSMAGAVFVAQATVKHDAGDVHATSHVAGILSQTTPHYPESAIKNKEEGTVVLTVLIGADGQPLRIVSVNAHEVAPDLIQAANDTIMQWRFKPATKNGTPIESYARVPITFSLDEKTSPAPSTTTGTHFPTSPSI
ncbi:MAG TPA: TonB family protein [Rhodanobacter sp.]|nr:TonB family protein [Rhodanobacter sp.]